MIEALKREVTLQGGRTAILPIHRLQAIRQDVQDLKNKGGLNHFQLHIVNSLYGLDVPEASFEIRSIIIVASPSPPIVDLTFQWQGKSIPAMLPASYVDKNRAPRRVEAYLKALLNPGGYHILYAPQLPHKLLAVRSGLGRYGRNNICYVEDMGSFLNLSPFFSDIPCPEDAWQEICQMELCQACQACLQNCPTGAILPERFLIDNECCLTYFNEAGSEWNFPDWIDPSAHHTLYGCLRCQAICPANQPYLKNKVDPVEFTEVETSLLLTGKSFELFPESLRQKVEALDMMNYFGAIPRNLHALLKN